jgi:hypothetical protein
MVKNIKDYIDKKVAIHCSTQEEWDAIIDLLKPPHCKKSYFNTNPCKGIDTVYVNGRGWNTLNNMNKDLTIYKARDFLKPKIYEVW